MWLGDITKWIGVAILALLLAALATLGLVLTFSPFVMP